MSVCSTGIYVAGRSRRRSAGLLYMESPPKAGGSSFRGSMGGTTGRCVGVTALTTTTLSASHV